MARTVAGLPAGYRVTDLISLGALAAKLPRELVDRVLGETGRQSQRQRQLPAHVVAYYVIALALYMSSSYGEVLRCLVEGLSRLGLPVQKLRQTGRSAISQARSRLGSAPLRRLFEEASKPMATEKTRGAFFRNWHLVAVDGTILDLADTTANDNFYGRPGASRGESGFPQMRAALLIESGTRAFFAAESGPYRTAETVLETKLLSRLTQGMLVLADRGLFSYPMWKAAIATKADLLWRLKADANLPCHQRLADGSYLSKIYPSSKARKGDLEGIVIRVIEYALDGVADAEPIYRLATTILDPEAAGAEELARLYHERWQIETAFDELKTHTRGPRVVLRSKTPDLVLQEFYGLLLAHYAVRSIMHEAALKAEIDPDDLSFVHSIRVIRRDILGSGSFPPSADSA